MEYRRLGRSDLQVSLLCLGSMTWGMQNSEDEAFAQMDYAFEQGVNFIDTAEMYPIATSAETYGRTEEIIGNWMQARGNREKVVVATKRSEEHTSELQSLMRISYAVFCLKKQNTNNNH